MRRKLHAIRDRLRQAYGRPRLRPHRRPVDELVLTVLSQNTNDRNRDVAYMRLRERFPSWEAVRRAPEDEVEEAIRPGGISRIKANRIQAMLRDLDGDNLEWMADAPPETGRKRLVELPGIGRKTAACVLLFSYRKPLFVKAARALNWSYPRPANRCLSRSALTGSLNRRAWIFSSMAPKMDPTGAPNPCFDFPKNSIAAPIACSST